ncbi:MAG: hypothetical protein QW666_01110 [Candidatus Woesearchaeota archaeon]
MKASDVEIDVKVSLMNNLIDKLKIFCSESVKDIMRLKTKLIALSGAQANLDNKKLRQVIASLEHIILEFATYEPESLDKIKKSIQAHLLGKPANKQAKIARMAEFEGLLDTFFKKTAEISALVSEERKDFSDISNIIKICREHENTL